MKFESTLTSWLRIRVAHSLHFTSTPRSRRWIHFLPFLSLLSFLQSHSLPSPLLSSPISLSFFLPLSLSLPSSLSLFLPLSLSLPLSSFSIGGQEGCLTVKLPRSLPLPPSLSPSMRCQSPKIAITASDNWAPNARARRDWPAHRPQPTFSCNLSGEERRDGRNRLEKMEGLKLYFLGLSWLKLINTDHKNGFKMYFHLVNLNRKERASASGSNEPL